MRTAAGSGLRFIYEVLGRDATNVCITWPFLRDKDGYVARVRFNGRSKRACAVICELAHGEKPTLDHEVAHSCGKGHLGCINPAHVRWATHKENCADKIAHGTVQRGEANGFAVLREAQVRVIMSLKGKASARIIAEEYEVSRETVSHIHNGRKWAHLFL